MRTRFCAHSPHTASPPTNPTRPPLPPPSRCPVQTNVSVCSSLGHPFLSQFNLIFLDMLQVYK